MAWLDWQQWEQLIDWMELNGINAPLARQRKLGVKLVLQDFTGHFPASLKEKNPDAELHTINWIDWTIYLLDPLDPLFEKVAGIFMEEQYERFGTNHLYAADTYVEMTPTRDNIEYLANTSKTIYPGIIWTGVSLFRILPPFGSSIVISRPIPDSMLTLQ